jgi:glyoxylase-like metal-dependent hydrolase (beta-lactamase superfamily II)
MSEDRSLEGLKSFQTPEGEISLAEHVVPLDDAALGVHGFRTIMVNLYAVAEPNGDWVLVDTGLPGSTQRILDWVARREFKLAPYAIVMTHGHFDHVGSLDQLSKHWNVPIYAHQLELPYLTGAADYPPPDPTVGGGLMSLMAPLYPKHPVNVSGRVQALPDDGSVPGLPSWRWIHTPGHTAGHISLFRDSDRTLIAGDAVITTKQESLTAILEQRAELHGPPAYFTNDWSAARESVRKLAELDPLVIASGHGKPIVGAAAAQGLAVFAREFDRLAIPAHGRYVVRST